jgi:tRNA pseudouridine-54 N-methylase
VWRLFVTELVRTDVEFHLTIEGVEPSDIILVAEEDIWDREEEINSSQEEIAY